ncbi:hypothetical protein Nepgr_023220 [Nepenthes gracilis]|uniref:Uncharacterized protein n=1 Tax=Nepenthes gracilis TaxID=150966 RepID=A0AAD3T0B3_NEPGR|nr:hypothetical protein Nepgr_023220 [Nepenthes gracilis]
MAAVSCISLSPKPTTTRHVKLKFICCFSLDRPINQITSNGVHLPKTVHSADGNLRIVFAAGGTGCQIYPAIAIADDIKTLKPDARILFIGTESSMESAAVPSAGYDFTTITATPLRRPHLSLENLILPFHVIKSVVNSWKKLRDFDPQIVVGTGGYVSFGVCLAAAMKGLKLVIQEQNSVPGIANWVLSVLADLVFVAYNSSVDCFPINKKKCVVCGNPVRLSLRKYVSKGVAMAHFFPRLAKSLDSEVKVILVLGGSLGAKTVNIAMFNLYHQMLFEHKNWFIIWETGVESFDEMESLVRSHSQLLLAPFLHSMDLAYAAADLVVSRAGAMTCSELLATGKPAILIPSPNVEEGHQFKNASLMADLAGSRIITEDELDSTTLGLAIEDILANGSLMAVMSERAVKASKPDAGAVIAQHILSLADLSNAK